MRIARHALLLLLAQFSSQPSWALEASRGCFNTLQSNKTSFEVYIGVADDRRTFVQRRGNTFGLSADAVPILESRADAGVASLCDGRLVAVWLPESYGKFPTFLTARFYDDRAHPLGEEYRVTDTDESEWEHSLAPLTSGGFVVVWKSQAETDIRIRGRVFDSTGRPLQKSFDVSSSPGQHGRASVYGLPTGGFIVLWHHGSAVLRVFNANGTPSSNEVKIADDDGQGGTLVPHGIVTNNGATNVFMTYFYDLHEKTPFRYARRFDIDGKPITEKLSGDAIMNLHGYREIAEQLVRKQAHALEYRLREFIQKDVMASRFCSHGFSAETIVADKIKTVTQDKAIKVFATKFCQQRRESCGLVKFRERDHERCATPG